MERAKQGPNYTIWWANKRDFWTDVGKRRISSEFKFLILWYKSSAGMAGARETACAPAAHECAPDGARQPRQPAWAPSGADCPAARGPPRRMRAAGAAEIEMTAPVLGLLCCGRQRRWRARSGLRAQACAPKVGVKSWPSRIEQHVHSSLRNVLKQPGHWVSLLSIITEHAQSNRIRSHDGGWGESSIYLK